MNLTQIIIIVIAVLILLLYAVWQIVKRGYRKTVIDLIVMAEKNFTDNKTKFETVVNSVIIKLPFPFNMIPISTIEKLVQRYI